MPGSKTEQTCGNCKWFVPTTETGVSNGKGPWGMCSWLVPIPSKSSADDA